MISSFQQIHFVLIVHLEVEKKVWCRLILLLFFQVCMFIQKNWFTWISLLYFIYFFLIIPPILINTLLRIQWGWLGFKLDKNSYPMFVFRFGQIQISSPFAVLWLLITQVCAWYNKKSESHATILFLFFNLNLVGGIKYRFEFEF